MRYLFRPGRDTSRIRPAAVRVAFRKMKTWFFVVLSYATLLAISIATVARENVLSSLAETELAEHQSESNTLPIRELHPDYYMNTPDEVVAYDQYRRVLHRYVHVSNCGPSSSGPCPANQYCTYCMYISRGGEGYKCQNVYDQNKCASCPSGKTSPYGSTSSSQCISCGAGKYRSGTSCVNCPIGRYYGGSGATSVSSCASCSAGYYSTGGAAACTACNAGSYTPSSMYGSCISCPKGYYQGSKGQASCIKCGAGKHPSLCVHLYLSLFRLLH